MSVWFDIKKEPLPTNVERVLVRYSEGDVNDFVVLHLHKYDKLTWVDINGPYDSYTYFLPNGGIDLEQNLCADHITVTHWQYIDPTGLPE